jgi:hypothetical protein
LEPAELENYSDFESDDSSSNVSVKKDSAVFEEKSDVKSKSSQQKDIKLVIGSCGKPQIVSLKGSKSLDKTVVHLTEASNDFVSPHPIL